MPWNKFSSPGTHVVVLQVVKGEVHLLVLWRRCRLVGAAIAIAGAGASDASDQRAICQHVHSLLGSEELGAGSYPEPVKDALWYFGVLGKHGEIEVTEPDVLGQVLHRHLDGGEHASVLAILRKRGGEVLQVSALELLKKGGPLVFGPVLLQHGAGHGHCERELAALADEIVSNFRQSLDCPPSVGGQHCQGVGRLELPDFPDGGAETLGHLLVARGDQQPTWSSRSVERIRVSDIPDVVEDEQ